MPEVVADARHHFESLFKPYKKAQLYVFEKKDNMWEINEYFN